MNRPDHRALLLVDLFSDFQFEDGEALARALKDAAPGIAAAAAGCRRQRIPVVYCNDNFGRWHDPWEAVLEFTAREGREVSAELLAHLRPQPSDIVLLKSRHSAFYQTQLPALLEDLKTRELAIAGAATDACVMCSALDAHMRGLDIRVLEDATAAASPARHERALAHLRESLDIPVLTHVAWLGRATASTAR